MKAVAIACVLVVALEHATLFEVELPEVDLSDRFPPCISHFLISALIDLIAAA